MHTAHHLSLLPSRDIDQERALVMALNLSPGQAAVLSCLMRTVRATSEDLDEYTGFSHAKVFVSKVRQKLKPNGVTIHSKTDIGYWIDPSGKEILEDIIKPYYEGGANVL